jgi:hypothetical protein
MKLILVCYMNKATDDEKDRGVARKHWAVRHMTGTWLVKTLQPP